MPISFGRSKCSRLLTVLCFSLFLLSLAFFSPVHAAALPELPRFYVETTMPTQTGATIQIPKRRVVRFSAGKSLKDAVR